MPESTESAGSTDSKDVEEATDKSAEAGDGTSNTDGSQAEHPDKKKSEDD